MAKRCLRCTISGRVQGVWFRACTQKEAQKLGVGGWVRNLPDGRVETLICGDESALASMRAWLAKGPALARVVGVEVVEVKGEECGEFRVVD